MDGNSINQDGVANEPQTLEKERPASNGDDYGNEDSMPRGSDIPGGGNNNDMDDVYSEDEGGAGYEENARAQAEIVIENDNEMLGEEQ